MVVKLQAVLLFLMLEVAGMRRGPHHPHGEQPVDRQHHHYRPRGDDSLTAEAQMLHDTKHLEEDSNILTAEDLAKMSPEELEFHYFSAHDFDRNSKLDGLEMLKAVYHTMEHEDHEETNTNNPIEPQSNDLDTFTALVDRTLELDDTDDDGFVSYAEYRAARQKNPVERTPHVLAAKDPT